MPNISLKQLMKKLSVFGFQSSVRTFCFVFFLFEFFSPLFCYDFSDFFRISLTILVFPCARFYSFEAQINNNLNKKKTLCQL